MYKTFFFPQIKCSILISTPGRSSTSELRSASQCRSRFFQYRLRHTPSALSHPPCTLCPLRKKRERKRKRKRVIREDEHTVPGFDTVVGFIWKENSLIEWHHQRLESVLSHWNVLCSCTRAWTQGRCNQMGKGSEWRHYKVKEVIVVWKDYKMNGKITQTQWRKRPV